MHNASESAGKRHYTTPQLTVHGTLDEVTKGILDKQWGGTDGLVFMGVTIPVSDRVS